MRVHRLLIAWAGLAAAILALRAMAGPSEMLATLYGGGSLALVGSAGLLAKHRWRQELLELDRSAWEHLTQFPGVGPGYHNNFRELAWVAQPAAAVPAHLRPLWLRARRMLWLPLAWFISTPVICILAGVGGA